MLHRLINLFKRRPLHHTAVTTGLEPITIMERTNHALKQQHDFHEGERTAFEALAAYYSERARQHREAAAALSDALTTLAVSDALSGTTLAHEALGEAIQADIASVQAATSIAPHNPFTTYGAFVDPGNDRYGWKAAGLVYNDRLVPHTRWCGLVLPVMAT